MAWCHWGLEVLHRWLEELAEFGGNPGHAAGRQPASCREGAGGPVDLTGGGGCGGVAAAAAQVGGDGGEHGAVQAVG